MTLKQRVELVPGYLLHQRPYRENSALLEIFTETHGRVGLVARGVRSARSKQRGDLQPFRPLQFSWQSRGELGTLTQVESGGVVGALRGRTLYSAFYLNELLLRLVARHDPHPELFTVYSASLQALAKDDEVEVVLRLFEIQLLQQLGYGLQLDCDVETGAALAVDALYDYHLESGPVRVESSGCGGFLFHGASLVAIARGELNEPRVLQDSKRLLRAALRLYLGDKPL
ncbi:DNA recombination and repair protein RecO, partial [hydrothermal vent metagenome]